MQIWESAEDIPADLGPTVVTIGIFDGVHRGHHAILSETVRQARATGRLAVALTFEPHPLTVHSPEREIHLVATLSDRLERLEAAGLDAVFVQNYTLDYAKASPAEFIDNQLVGELKAAAIVVGEDVRFGRDNCGDGDYLVAHGALRGLQVTLLDDIVDEGGERLSSTRVRECLACGDVEGAARILGRAHRVRGIVQHGFKRGRELGFPTANLTGESLGEVPADGVYAGWLIRDIPGTKAQEHLPAAISVGTNPQFDGEVRTVEAHVLGRTDLNLYGEAVAIDFIAFLRPMLKMNSVEELLNQMDEDLRGTAEVLGVPVSHRVNPEMVTAR